jgi:AcrR family transcriptional regulator
MSEYRETGTSAARALLIDAFTKEIAARGYANVSVEKIASDAGVSPKVFFEIFSGKDQCLLAAYDSFVDRLFSHAVSAGARQPTWPEQVKAATGAILNFFSEVESASRVFTVEAPGAGAAALERRITSIDRFAALLRSGRQRYPAAAVLPGATERVLVAGFELLVTVHLLAEEGSVLPGLQPELVELLLTPYLGGSEARRVAGV